jgi:hypothetical protein
MRHNGQRSPQEIEQEIARTRGDMDATLSALEQRLTPGQLVDQGLDYLKRSGPKEFVSNLGDSAKQNPLPVALVGIGLAWLMATGNRSQRHDYTYAQESTGPGMGQRASEGLASAKERLSQSATGVRERAGQLSGSLKERVGLAGERVGQMRSQMGERVGQMGQGARQQAERLRSGYESMMREQPLALGAVGLAIGAVLAAATPRTRTEDELMGEASDRLAERAKTVGKEQLEQAKAAGKEQLEKMQEKTPGKPQEKTSQGAATGSPASQAPAPGQPRRTEVSAKSPGASASTTPATPKDPRFGTP